MVKATVGLLRRPRCISIVVLAFFSTLWFTNMLAFNRLAADTQMPAASSPSSSKVTVVIIADDSTVLKDKLRDIADIVQVASSSAATTTKTTTSTTAAAADKSSSSSSPANKEWFSYFDKVKHGLQRAQHRAGNSELPEGEDNPTLAVRWYGPFWSGGGYSSEAIAFVTSIKYITPMQIFHMGDMYREEFIRGVDANTVHELRTMEQTFIEPSKSISVCHTPPREWFATVDDQSRVRCPPEGAAYTIGRTMFETDGIPAAWTERLNRMDMVWVPSAFNANTFKKAGVNESRIHIMPESVDVAFFNPSAAQPSPFMPRNITQYAFLSVFKWEERKGWRFLLEAYLSEFMPADNVVLYILSDQDANSPKLQQQMTQHFVHMGYDARTISKLPEIRFIRRGIGQSELRDLYFAADAFVLPSRGEGWGRPHVEAMSMALPVIATAWSGPQEYMTEENSYPLSIDGLETIDEPVFFKGFRWARPSVKHLRKLMRHVRTHREEATKKGQQARKDMKQRYCPACVAKLVVKELRRIETLLHLKPQFSPSFSLHSDDIVAS